MLNLESYKRQETALILINIAVLAALFVVHIIFLFQLGSPSNVLIVTLSIRFFILIFELIWVQKTTSQTPKKQLRIYTHFSIWINISFAFIASIFGGAPDSHYSVLMIIPIISSAYHFKLWQTLSIISVTVFLTFLEIWIFFQQKPPIDYGEFFEAATVSLIFFVVGFVAWLLVGSLKDEEAKLKESLAKLQETQAKLVAEEKLAAVGQLSSAIAHEIRNPVAMIASSLAMAAKQQESSPLRQELFDIATQEASRLETLTSDFLTFARSKEPEIQTHTVIETLEYVASLAKAKLAEKDVEMEVVCQKELTGNYDASQIRQALVNLVLNAIDATIENSLIKIGAEIASENLIFWVENNGEKIPAEIVEKIFEPFFTAKPKGTGLGLSIVRKIARMHKGDIFLANNEKGNVRFEIVLPK